MHRVAGLRVGAIEEHRDAPGMTVNEPGTLQCLNRLGQVAPVEDDIDAARIANDGLVDLSHPMLAGISTDHGLRHARLVQRPSHSAETVPDVFHGSLDPCPKDIA
jgi:hypothetical protein